MCDSSHLTAKELLAKGLEKLERVLPSKGSKIVTPIGTWVEQKEIQEALETRRRLVADERVEKWGGLSRAEWLEDRGLALVTEQRGSYWNHLGHLRDKQLFLYPEEALHLVETNCLDLKYNGITMSIQQAYAVLLNDTITIREYKVYSQLSRVGYKIMRTAKNKKISNVSDSSTNVVENIDKDSVNEIIEDCHADTKTVSTTNCNNELHIDKEGENKVTSDIEIGDKSKENESNDVTDREPCMEVDMSYENVAMETSMDKTIDSGGFNSEIDASSPDNISRNNQEVDETPQRDSCVDLTIEETENIQINSKLKKSVNTKNEENNLPKFHNKMKSLPSLKLPDYFENISNILGNWAVSISPPEEDFLPRRVFLHKSSYMLNIAEITSKQRSTDNAAEYEVEHNARTQIRDDPVREAILQQQNAIILAMKKGANILKSIRHREAQSMFAPQYVNVNNLLFAPRLRFNSYRLNNMHRLNMHRHNMHRPNTSQQIPQQVNNAADATRKTQHLQAIRRISFKLRKLKKSGDPKQQNFLISLKKLVGAFNSRYGENLEITSNLTLQNDCDNVDTVTLDDDDEPKLKKRKANDERDDTDRNRLLERIKTAAKQLKELRNAGEQCFRNRRSLIGAIRVFNKKFNTSITLTENLNIVDTKQVVIDSSSDSDCVVTEEESSTVATPHKARCIALAPCTSKQSEINDDNFYAVQSSNFQKWLPKADDWGRAEVTPSFYSQHRLIKSNQDSLIYDYLQTASDVNFEDWEHLKSEFWNMIAKNSHMEEVPLEMPPCDVEPLLSPEDCVDLETALEKVRIIKGYPNTVVETDLSVVFDVYERDVKNFKKSNPPVPNFRIACIDEGKPIPDISQILSLAEPFEDKSPIVLAVVGANISYTTVSRVELPVYVKKHFI